jgi:copper chaperone NosL
MNLSKILIVLILSISCFLTSCNSGPQPIKLGTDACSFCKMSIADKHFGAEIISKKGKVFKFDDTHCVLAFLKENELKKDDVRQTWLINYEEPHNFIPAEKAFLLKSDELHSPMGGNIAAFENEKQLEETMKTTKGEKITWGSLTQ